MKKTNAAASLRSVRLSILLVLSLLGVGFPQAAVAQALPLIEGDGDRSIAINPAPGTATGDAASDEFDVYPITSDVMYSVSTDTSADGVSGVAEKLVYDNPLGQSALELPDGQRLADDLTLSVKPDCPLTRYRFQVIGKANPDACGGAGMTCGPLRVDFSLWDGCPNANGVDGTSSTSIEGTAGCASTEAGDTTPQGVPCIFLPDADALTEIEFVPSVPVALPSRVWLAVTMSRTDAGVIVGAPALLGFSSDVLDSFSFPCNSTVGGFPTWPHSSFNASIYGDETCSDASLTYQNIRAGNSGYTDGAFTCIAEDITLNRTCNMVQMEVAVRGRGRYDFELRQRTVDGSPEGFCNDFTAFGSNAIEGSKFVFVNMEEGLNVFRKVFDPPVPLPDENLHVVFMGNNSNAKWVLTRNDASIGSTDATFYVFTGNASAGSWALNNTINYAHAGFHVTITCDGPPPVGACCDMFILDEARESVCRDVPEINCGVSFADPEFQPGWVEGMNCADEPFPHTCGQAACCTPDDTCENLSINECLALPPTENRREWTLGEYCESLSEPCLPHACLQSPAGDCFASHEAPGCDDIFCCVDICTDDSWCCQQEWDLVCIREAGDAPRECRNEPENGQCDAATPVTMNTNTIVSNITEWNDLYEPEYTCLQDGVGAVGSIWFSFVADDTSAIANTCATASDGTDTVIQGYRVDGSPVDPCEALVPIACADNAPGCAGGIGSRICMDDLVVGDTYYIAVSSASDQGRGPIVFNVTSPCLPSIPDDYDPSDEVRALETEEDEKDEVAPMAALVTMTAAAATGVWPDTNDPIGHLEQLDDPHMPRPHAPPPGIVAGRTVVERDGFVSVQVNVDEFGDNIPGDAANEPSIAVDPTSPNRMVIGWRQFDTIQSNFRQAGVGYSHDSGATWTFPGVLTPEVFRSDPVLVADADGYFHYLSLGVDYPGCHINCDLFTSTDGGITWGDPVYAFGGDKAWITADTTGGPGRNHLYQTWSSAACEPGTSFSRSTDRGESFRASPVGTPSWGTLTVDLNGVLYAAGDYTNGAWIAISDNAQFPDDPPSFDRYELVELGGGIRSRRAPNPGGLLGQMWIRSDRGTGPTVGDLYVLASVTQGETDPLDVMFSRSENGAYDWSEPVRVNDDPINNGAWQWFGTMDVAPNGRIDAVWNDTRNTGQDNLSELYYAFSTDGGRTWSKNIPVSPVFDSHIGWPSQNKLGDYYDMVSEDDSVNIAYAATFNGEQDVYFLRIPAFDCGESGIPDVCSPYSKGNGWLDICQRDFDRDGIIDACDSDADNDGFPNLLDPCPWTPLDVGVLADGRPRPDTTGDCYIDFRDYWRFWNCFEGGLPGLPAPFEACMERFDTNDDMQLNLRDAAVFQNAYTGPGI